MRVPSSQHSAQCSDSGIAARNRHLSRAATAAHLLRLGSFNDSFALIGSVGIWWSKRNARGATCTGVEVGATTFAAIFPRDSQVIELATRSSADPAAASVPISGRATRRFPIRACAHGSNRRTLTGRPGEAPIPLALIPSGKNASASASSATSCAPMRPTPAIFSQSRLMTLHCLVSVPILPGRLIPDPWFLIAALRLDTLGLR